MARVAFEDAIAEWDNVADDSYKDSTMFRQCRPSDLSPVQMMAPEVVHGEVPREVCEVCLPDFTSHFFFQSEAFFQTAQIVLVSTTNRVCDFSRPHHSKLCCSASFLFTFGPT